MATEEKKSRGGNPTLRNSIYEKAGRAVDSANAMTVDGAIGKTGILLSLVVIGGMITWNLVGSFYATYIMPLVWFGLIGGFILALIISFKSTTAPYLSPIYAILKGLALGGISALLNYQFPGIAFQAICLTVLVASLMLVLYKFRVIRATEKFKSVIILATAAIAVFYLVSIILSFFNVTTPLSLANTSLLAIGINLVVAVVAALNLIIDFDFIEKGEEYGSPKYLEWYGAFGLTVTLVWLYLEILKLLARFAQR